MILWGNYIYGAIKQKGLGPEKNESLSLTAHGQTYGKNYRL